jgi:hypothetical protein
VFCSGVPWPFSLQSYGRYIVHCNCSTIELAKSSSMVTDACLNVSEKSLLSPAYRWSWHWFTSTFFLNYLFTRLFPIKFLYYFIPFPLGHVSYCHHFSSVVCPSTFHILIFSSETTGRIATKLWWNGPWVPPPWKMCPVIPTSNQDSHQAKNGKKGDEIFKKSSPLKLRSQSQPNFAEMILGWSSSKIVSGISDLRPRWPPQPNLI